MTKHRNRTIQRRPVHLMGEKTEQSMTDCDEQNSPSQSMVDDAQAVTSNADCPNRKE